MALLRFEHLSFSYPLADMRALDDVSLEIHKCILQAVGLHQKDIAPV